MTDNNSKNLTDMLRNSQDAYGLIAKAFHWISAVIIIILFVLGVWMVELEYEHDWYDSAIHYHESIGILCSIFIALRVLWRWYDPQPRLLATITIIEQKSAQLVHCLLYFCCIAILISGYLIPTADTRDIAVFTWFLVPSLGSFHHLQADIAGDIHYWLAYGLMALLTLHVLASCKHHFIDKDNTIKRIL